MVLPPRPFLTEEEIRALSDQERAVAIAEWSSYNARLRLEQEQRAARGSYRGGRARRARGRGRGYYGPPSWEPYSRAPYPQRPFHSLSATFNQPASPATPASPPNDSSKPIGVNGASSSMYKQPGNTVMDSKRPCPAFTSTGVCKRSRCPYVHDPDKTAICKQFLFKGVCIKGASCPLSHDPSANRSPNCIHFLDSHCNKDDCRYAHVNVSADAPVCEAFARLGYCEKGDECADRHAFECPDYTNKGACDVSGCRLAHVVHAGRLRKARKSSEAASRSTSNSPEIEVEKLDDIEQDHALTQQADFVPFES